MSLVGLNPRHKRSPRNLLLNDVFPRWNDGYGIFSFIVDYTPYSESVIPWDTPPRALDVAYHGEHSGNKFVSPFLYRYLYEDGTIDEDGGIERIVKAIDAKYLQKWTHLWNIYSAEYNPLDTYNLAESGSRSGTVSTSGTSYMDVDRRVSDTGEDTTTTNYGHTITDSGTPESTTTDQVQGFNSTAYVDKTKSTNVSTTDNLTTNGGEDSVELAYGKVEYIEGTDTGNTSGSETSSETFSSTKRGTMYRAPAELMSLDRDFWLQEYFTIVFADVDDMLTLDIYPEREPIRKVF